MHRSAWWTSGYTSVNGNRSQQSGWKHRNAVLDVSHTLFVNCINIATMESVFSDRTRQVLKGLSVPTAKALSVADIERRLGTTTWVITNENIKSGNFMEKHYIEEQRSIAVRAAQPRRALVGLFCHHRKRDEMHDDEDICAVKKRKKQ